MDVVIERITADEAVKVIDVRIAMEEEVAAVFISAKVHRVGQTSSPTSPAIVPDQMQTAPTASA